MSITFSKLRSGEWGIRGPASAIKAGANVTVTKRDGSTTDAIVYRVVWTDQTVTLASILQKPKYRRPNQDSYSAPETANDSGAAHYTNYPDETYDRALNDDF
jgi:hypothetical protein